MAKTRDKFDMKRAFDKKEKTEEITMRDTIRITATTVSPLLQISEAGGQRKRYEYEGDVRGIVPFFSANGLRGSLRRIATRQQILAAKESDKDFECSPETFYLYTSGAGLDKTAIKTPSGEKMVPTIGAKITSQNEQHVRKMAPILSLFGAGLSAIEGMLAVADIKPSSSMEKFGKTDDGRAYSLLMGHDTNFRVDSIKNAGLWRSVVDVESIKQWSEYYLKKVVDAKAKKKSGESDSESDSHIQQPVNADFILPGVTMTSSINAKYGYELSDTEIGCLVSALHELSLTQIGSAKRNAWGVLEWTVEMNGEVLFKTTPNPDYVLDISSNITETGKKYIDQWQSWLKNGAHSMDIDSLIA